MILCHAHIKNASKNIIRIMLSEKPLRLVNLSFYYHGLTDTISKRYYLVTDKDSTKIKDSKAVQYFDNSDSLDLGTEKKEYNGSVIRIFNRERMLVELIKHKNRLPFDYYKEDHRQLQKTCVSVGYTGCTGICRKAAEGEACDGSATDGGVLMDLFLKTADFFLL